MRRHLVAFLACAGVFASAGGALAAGSGCLNTTAKLDGAQTPSTPVPADTRTGTAG